MYMSWTDSVLHAVQMEHKIIQRDMPMGAGNKPQERESRYERNEDDITTRRMINMIMGTGSGKKGIGTTDYDEATEPYLMELRKIFVRKLLATCTSFSEGIF